MKHSICFFLAGVYSLSAFSAASFTPSDLLACKKAFALIKPVNQLEGLSDQTKTLLNGPRLKLVGDLTSMTEEELKTMGLDSEAVFEINQVLEKQDLSLGMEITDWPQSTEHIRRLAKQALFEDMPKGTNLEPVFFLSIDELNFPLNDKSPFAFFLKKFDKSVLSDLKKRGKKLIGHLVTTTEDELKTAGFDDKAILEIEQTLSQRGLRIGMIEPSEKWFVQSAVALAIVENTGSSSATPEALKIQNQVQAAVAVMAMKQYKPAFAVREALKIQNQVQAAVAVMAMKQYKPAFAVREALKIQTQAQADVAVMAMKQYKPAFAVREALKIQNQVQAAVAVMAMETYNPEYAVKQAIRIKTQDQANFVLSQLVLNPGMKLHTAVEQAQPVK